MTGLIRILQLFARSSSAQGKRAVLTIAAIAWGTLALLLMLAFGEGMKISLYRGSQGMGSNLAIMWPGETSLIFEGLPSGRPVRPRIEDIELLKKRVEGHAGISGEMHNGGVVLETDYGTRTARVIGATHDYGEIRNHIPQIGGRFLNETDQRLRRRTIFLGNELAVDLFGEEDPVGRQVMLNKTPYTVVGVIIYKVMMGNYGGMESDHAVIPITTYKAQFGRDRLSHVVVKAADPARIDELVSQVHRVLGSKYMFDPEDPAVFSTWDTVEGTQTTTNMMLGIQLFLGVIGALTLLVGGVGVANIMYAVVKERTREIGVKMALGARPSWITGPIVLEGLAYTLVGGLLGVLMAVGLIALLDMIPTKGNDVLELMGKPTLSIWIGIGSAAVLGIIGLLSGYFPARRAAAIDPAETLRYE
ncbi:MAG: ABC transporter permease [Acidobacteria bacterium]|uniref:ABC transporter permease n=1 Tax=Candidatus Polarisedimenticola svalbardensis TaxID=2886004 RepID=A0A8J7C254_9BACT|nr:ABC transporter permease [Candidatus Polarisedimenticola svalbardensis]